jgi:nicotinate-nucleotide--dimethylbenzimidazole phosphoribosyltransferase
VTEILTESFCERCGTRYTFESAAPRRSRLGRVRTLSKGMKNFVLSDDASFSEAMAEARSEEELAVVSHQLDAFHQTFNFCLTCRQYTCGDCWNTAEGRCLTCAPVPGMEEPAFAAAPALEMLPEPGGAYDTDPEPDAWPDEDLSAARLSRALGLDEAEAEATLEAATLHDDTFDLAAAEAAAAAVAAPTNGVAPAWDGVAGSDGLEPDVDEPVAAVEPATIADGEAGPAVAGVAPGQSLQDAVAEYEARIEAEEDERSEAALAEAAAVAAAAVDVPIAQIEVEDDATIELPEPIAEAAADPTQPAPHVEPAGADAEPIAPEADALAPVAGEADALAPVAAEAADRPVSEAAAEPVAAVAGEVAPLAPATMAEPEPEREPAVPTVAAAAAAETPDATETPRVDVVSQPTWPEPAPAPGPDVAAPPAAAPTPPANPWLRVAPDEPGDPQWPAAPAFPVPATRRDMPTTLAGRPLLPQVDPADMWAASAREVLTGTPQAPIPPAAAAPTAQPCVSCGLSLSANARFCRRCGTRQG